MSKTTLSYFQNKPCLLSRHSWREGISSSRNQKLRSNWSGKVTEKNGETRMETPANQRILVEIRWKTTKEIQ
jgi:hypothetical protein